MHSSLTGAHAHLARTHGRAVTYRADVSTFCAVPTNPQPEDWNDLAHLLGPGALADLFDCPEQPPKHWKPVFTVDGIQMHAPPTQPATAPELPPGTELVELGPTDRQAMLDLATRTRPGPFHPQTAELGTYLGIRHHGTLLAMAGERLHPPGWTEISAVCTAPEARGRRYAATLAHALSQRIDARGQRAFLHVLHTNTPAINLYTQLGFKPHRTVRFRGFEVP